MLKGSLPWHKAQTEKAILEARDRIQQQEFVGQQEYVEFLSIVDKNLTESSTVEQLLDFCKEAFVIQLHNC